MNVYVWLPVAFGFLGWLFSSRPVVLFMNGLTPIQGLIVYYIILFVTLEILQLFGLIIGGVRMQSMRQTLGELLLVFAFFVIVDWESAWVQDVVAEDLRKKDTPDIDRQSKGTRPKETSLGGQALDCPNIYLQAEDGAVYYFMNTYVTAHKETARYLTFVGTPIVLSAIGLWLTQGVVKRSLF